MKRSLLFFSVLIASLVIGKQVSAQIIFYVTNPPSLVGTYDFTYVDGTDWGISLDTVFVQGQLVIVDDGTAADSLGCDPLVNGAQIAGNIAVVYRGACEFGQKALNAQNAGAIGVIIINNAAGPPVGMGGGTFGTQVIIPTIMVGQSTGAALRNEIDLGNVTAMIGNKSGVFPNDLGAFAKDIVIPNSWAIPSGIATNASAFEIPVGAWVTNFGQNDQTNVTLEATISLGASVLYNHVSTPMDINSLDDAFISLPVFSQSTYADGLYTLEYTISGSGVDDFPDDNNLVTYFWIQPDYYSKSRWDPVTLSPIRTSHYTSGGTWDEFMWCIIMDHPNSGNLTAHGISFSAVAAAALPNGLTGLGVELLLFEWNDVFTDSATFNSLSPLTTGEFYDYVDNTLSGVFVDHMFTNPIPLSNNTRYLACVRTDTPDIFIGADDNIDYETSWDAYNPSATQFDDMSVFTPTRTIDQGVTEWFLAGFGSSPVPAIILNTSALGVGINETLADNVLFPYPNPGSDNITVPFNMAQTGKVVLTIYDITGRSVKTEVVNLNNNNSFTFNTKNLNSGYYQLNLRFADESVTTFPLVLTK